jgi:AcrR family transcriptional regulator
VGLRELKKERTRQLIADTALRLFADRGFDQVTVAEVAREAEVAESTLFNYFPTKEDLFFSQMEAFETRLVVAVRDRPPGESALSAFQRIVLDGTARLAADQVADLIAQAARLIARSPALQAREREVVARATEALASVIAAETKSGKDAVEPWALAGSLLCVQRALVRHVRARVLAGRRGPGLAADAKAQTKRAFALLEKGFADYDTKPASPKRRSRTAPGAEDV